MAAFIKALFVSKYIASIKILSLWTSLVLKQKENLLFLSYVLSFRFYKIVITQGGFPAN